MNGRLALWVSLMCAGLPCLAQTWSAGVSGGVGWYRDAIIKNAAGSASAGFGSHAAASAVLGEDTTDSFGGELRYTYRAGNAELHSGGSKAAMDGITHAVHYDFLFYSAPRQRRIRPYLAAGAGVKYYSATGSQNPFQPLRDLALLTHAHEVEPLISFGAGVKIALAEHWLVRVDFRDYATPFPEKLVTPAPGAGIHGWLHDFVTLAGVDWVFRKR
jgi:hypothetical protein